MRARRSARSCRAPPAPARRPRGEALPRLLPAGVILRLVARSARTSARTTSRASASEPISPSDIACTSRLPSSVASSGPASTGSPAALAVQRQSSSLRAPPPTTWISRGAAPVTRGEHVDRLRVLQREALEDAAHDRAGLDGLRLAGVRAERAHPRRHVAGSANGGVVRLDEATAAAARPSRARRAGRTSSSRPSSAQARRHSCTSQSPVTLRSSRKVPSTPPSLVRFAANDASVITRLVGPRARRATTCRR